MMDLNFFLKSINNVFYFYFFYVQVKGTAVGFMSVCSTVDVELLSSCFDLKPFNGLQKLRGLTPVPRGTCTKIVDLQFIS